MLVEKARIIRTEEDWIAYDNEFKSGSPEHRPEFPFMVFSVESHSQQMPPYVHHFVTRVMAKWLTEGDEAPVEFTHGKIDGVHQTDLPCFEDPRGWLVELARKDELRKLNRMGHASVGDSEMTYVSMTKAGEVRGPHSHVVQADVFTYLQATFEVFLWDDRPQSNTYRCRMKVRTDPAKFTRIIIPAGVVHAYRAIDKDGLTINCPDKLYRGWDKKKQVDEVRWEDRQDSPFKLW